MRIFYSFLFCTAVLQGMEPTSGPVEGTEDLPTDSLDYGYERALLPLALQKGKRRAGSLASSTDSNKGTADEQYKTDAHALLSNVDPLDTDFTDDEVVNALKYYRSKYSMSYSSFMAKVQSLKGQNSEQSQLQRYQLAYDFALMARQYRHEVGDFHLETADKLTQNQVALMQENQEQITKTKYVKLRAYGVAVGGCIVTIITGLLTYFLHPVGTGSNGSTTPPANNNTL